LYQPPKGGFALYERSDITSQFIKLHKLRSALLLKQLKEFELTSPQLLILRELFMNQPMMLSTLAKAVDLSNSTVSGIVDRLELKGLVQRQRDEADRRIVWINTTEKCQQMKQKQLEKFHDDFQKEFLALITEEQHHIMRELFEKIIVLMEKKLEEKA
jgi:DNA-binding MarR family transcriptional regulator